MTPLYFCSEGHAGRTARALTTSTPAIPGMKNPVGAGPEVEALPKPARSAAVAVAVASRKQEEDEQGENQCVICLEEPTECGRLNCVSSRASAPAAARAAARAAALRRTMPDGPRLDGRCTWLRGV